jgi:MinD superfamily P-loop ATPase
MSKDPVAPAGFRIAVASGKGGTGKTTVATSLAMVLAEAALPAPVVYVDCDVEEPNGHIYLHPQRTHCREATILVPHIDTERCDLCGVCADVCRFSAIVPLPQEMLLFPQRCHGCGGCTLACPRDAISEVPRPIGTVERGTTDTAHWMQGLLNIGEPMAPPLIRALLQDIPKGHIAVLDAPPGTSCPVVTTVRDADAVLLVTEPTPFGLHDLRLAVDMVRELRRPVGVVVNRAGSGDEGVYSYCRDAGVPILMEIPDGRDIAQQGAHGEPLVRTRPELVPHFRRLYDQLRDLAQVPPLVAMSAAPASTGAVDVPEATSLSAPMPLEPVPGAAPRKEPLPELAVISGKGGAGKTSITASLVSLAGRSVIADCDVDAADLHLLLRPRIRHRAPFSGGSVAVLDAALCTSCGTCYQRCRMGAIVPPAHASDPYQVDSTACEGCGVCVDGCPSGALSLQPSVNGERFVSDTDFGLMVHARLGVAEENSGKLVSWVRGEAARRVTTLDAFHVSDGPPGIGCPVIAALTGVRFALIVTEPSMSGIHDLRRALELCRQLGVSAGICINKADISPALSAQIEAEAQTLQVPVLQRIRFDPAVTQAQIHAQPVVLFSQGPAAEDIRSLWQRVQEHLT